MAAGMAFADLITALDLWRKEGELRYSTASNLRGACDRVLGTLHPDELEDVSEIDISQAIARFESQNPDVSESSVKMYRSRVEKAIELFLLYRQDPENWKQAIKQRSPRIPYVVPSPASVSQRVAEPVPVPADEHDFWGRGLVYDSVSPPTGQPLDASNAPRSSNGSGRGRVSHPQAAQPTVTRSANSHTLNIPFPLRPGVTIHISGLPHDLKSEECERIIAFLRPLVTDYKSATGA